MRDYSKVSPQFWIGPTGKKLRLAGAEAQIVAMYLMTSPHANMLGLYYCPEMFIAHETGLGIEGACKGLQSAIDSGFCEYDHASEMVWVMEMATYQIADELKGKDLRVKGVQNEYDSLPENPYLVRFYDKYCDAFKMSKCRGLSERVIGFLEGASKPLVSQEQEQEQEQEQKLTTNTDVLVVAGNPAPHCPHQKIIELYGNHLPTMPFPKIWEGQRQQNLAARWRWVLTAKKPDGAPYATDTESALSFFDRFFGYVAKSDFLTGRDGKWHGCDLGWLVKAENFAKVVSGNYENKEAA